MALFDLSRLALTVALTRAATAVHRGAGAWLAVLCCLLASNAFAAAPVLYRCPGNLFTNDLSAAEARAQACVPAERGGLSQGVALSVSVPVLASDEARPVAAGAPVTVSPAQSAPVSAAPVPARSTANPVTNPGTAMQRGLSGLQRVDVALQRERDRDALAILQAELNRNRSAQQALAGRGSEAPAANELQRLRADETALQRELERHRR